MVAGSGSGDLLWINPPQKAGCFNETRCGEERVPYSSIDDLPASVRTHLPPHAQEIYVGAFNGAWDEYAREGAQEREKGAHRVAWAAVKRKYVKMGNSWIARGD